MNHATYISHKKAIRDKTGKTLYPLTVYNNATAGKNTQKEGCHEFCDFDEPVKVDKANMKFREMRSGKVQMFNTLFC